MRKGQLIEELKSIDGICVTRRLFARTLKVFAYYYYEMPYGSQIFDPKKIMMGAHTLIGDLDLSRTPSYFMYHIPKPSRETYEGIGKHLDQSQNAVLETLAKYGIATKSPQDMHLVK